MTDTATAGVPSDDGAAGGFGAPRTTPELWRMAWRNIMRTKRRTFLIAGGIAFAVIILGLMRSLQVGAFLGAVDNTARMMLGHIQLQHPDYEDEPVVEHRIEGVGALMAELRSRPGVDVVSARATAFALTSSGERSFGSQIVGVDYEAEARWSSLTRMQVDGRYLAGPGESFIGSALARNLGVGPGDELIVLGTATEGGVAALVTEVVGTYTTGQAEVDRAIVQVPITDFREAWTLGPDAAHTIVVVTESLAASETLTERLRIDGVRTLGWRDLQPELVQMMELKLVGTYVMLILVAIVVVFSVVNAFMMIIFERTPEFGMLMAVGMRPQHIVLQLQLEALMIFMIGALMGIGSTVVGIGLLSETGVAVPLPADAAEVLEMMSMPDRIYPELSVMELVLFVPLMLVGTQFAALVPSLRLRRLPAVEALRTAE